MIHHRTTAAITLTVALAATAAPTASADPPPLARAEAAIAHISAQGGPCSEVCSGQGYTAAQPASATPASTAPRSEVVSGGGYGPVTAPATVVRLVTPGSGFDWGDAGIGAGSMLALTLIGLGGVLSATNRRGRQTHDEHLSASS